MKALLCSENTCLRHSSITSPVATEASAKRVAKDNEASSGLCQKCRRRCTISFSGARQFASLRSLPAAFATVIFDHVMLEACWPLFTAYLQKCRHASIVCLYLQMLCNYIAAVSVTRAASFAAQHYCYSLAPIGDKRGLAKKLRTRLHSAASTKCQSCRFVQKVRLHR